ncbi:Uncharacterised protein [Vibrio cholerae]|nr:Uncharacterised protein [Vibrio cholerae]CSI30945.1 Uncharacterised protein [Vibrio cholerae]CSI55129.1 Uncharacterised protein [Vibrio cholerae]
MAAHAWPLNNHTITIHQRIWLPPRFNTQTTWGGRCHCELIPLSIEKLCL